MEGCLRLNLIWDIFGSGLFFLGHSFLLIQCLIYSDLAYLKKKQEHYRQVDIKKASKYKLNSIICKKVF